MRIKSRLYLNSALAVVLAVILIVVVILSSSRIVRETEKYVIGTNLLTATSELDAATYEYLSRGGTQMAQQWSARYTRLGKVLEEATKRIGLPLSILTSYSLLWESFSQLAADSQEINRLIQERAPQEEIAVALQRRKDRETQLLTTSQSISTDAYLLASTAASAVLAFQNLARIWTLVSVLLLAAIVATTSVVVGRSISKPLGCLTQYARRIGKGEYATEIEIKGRDEISTMALDVKTMVGKLMQMQDKLLASERLATLGQFAGNISHELRNPLSVIDSSAYYLRATLKDTDEKVREHLQRIESSVDNCTAIIESLLDLTRMKEPRLERLDLSVVVQDVLAASKVPAAVSLSQSYPNRDLPLDADGEQLSMAFKNIVKNAIEAMEGKGRLAVSIRCTHSGQAELSFTDTGPGIAAENLEKVFQPLFSTKAKGIGFGLSIAKLVIDKHGGTIAAVSKPGMGASIIITLPLPAGQDRET